MQKKMSKR